MAEGKLPKIALKWMPKQKRARRRPKKKLDGWYKEGHERKKPNTVIPRLASEDNSFRNHIR